MAESPMDKIRSSLLSKGASGIKAISRKFRILDRDASGTISKDEFQMSIGAFGVPLNKHEVDECFKSFDKDESGFIDFEEFLEKLRPPMSDKRKALVKEIFTKLDKTGDGLITTADLKGRYNVQQHPKFVSGEWTEEKCLQGILSTFEEDGDNQVTWEEFLNYYSGLSSSISDDIYFETMVDQAWGKL